MSYRSNDLNRNPRPNWRAWGIVSLIVLFVILVWGGDYFVGWFRGPATRFSTSGWVVGQRMESYVSSLNIAGKSKTQLWDEYRRLEARAQALQLQSTDRDNLANEVSHLRSLLGLSVSGKEVVVGKIISNPWSSSYDQVVLDLGIDNSQREVKIGDLVTFGNIALGRIVSVHPHNSVVKLFSAGGWELPVRLGASSTPAVAHGIGGGNMKLRLPRGAEIELEMPAQLSVSFGDFVVGVVGEIEKPPSESMQTVYLRSPINVYQLKYLEIYVD